MPHAQIAHLKILAAEPEKLKCHGVQQNTNAGFVCCHWTFSVCLTALWNRKGTDSLLNSSKEIGSVFTAQNITDLGTALRKCISSARNCTCWQCYIRTSVWQNGGGQHLNGIILVITAVNNNICVDSPGCICVQSMLQNLSSIRLRRYIFKDMLRV